MERSYTNGRSNESSVNATSKAWWNPGSDIVSTLMFVATVGCFLIGVWGITTSVVSGVGVRIDRIESDIDRIESRMDRMAADIEDIESRMDRIESDVAGIDSRMDRIETRMDRIETDIDRIENRLAVAAPGQTEESGRHQVASSTVPF